MVLGPFGRFAGRVGRRARHQRDAEERRQDQELSDLVRAEREASGEPAPSDDPPVGPRPTDRAQWDEKRQVWVEWDDGRGEWVAVG